MIPSPTVARLGWLVSVAAGLFFAGCRSPLPEAGDTREVISLNENWRFAKDLPSGDDYSATDYDDSSWEPVTLPHTPKIEPLIVNDQWQGEAWYRRSIEVPEQARGRKVFIRFEGAMQVADVWLDGKHLGTHYGGYLPFGFDVTRDVDFGHRNTLAVKLVNRDDPAVPPGKALDVLDFNYYGGIYRNVDLVVTGDLYITDPNLVDVKGGGGVVAYSSDVTPASATINVRVHVQNDAETTQSASVRITLQNARKVVTLSATSDPVDLAPGGSHTFTLTRAMESPELWSPEHPSLYRLTAEVNQGLERLDSVSLAFGVREFRLGPSGGFYINGERTFLRGTNYHQEYPYVGYAVPNRAQYRDAVKMKDAGFDMVRLSHYPHSEAFMRAADELGLVLMDCIPGWQFFGDELFQERSIDDVRQMARRDRNHASVAFWEVSLNESEMDDAFMDRANEALKEELPGQSPISAGWMDHAGYDLFLPARQHGRPPDYWNHYRDGERPILIAEYGDWEYYAQNAGFNQPGFEHLAEEERTSRQLRGAGEERLLQQALNYQEAANSNRKGASTIGQANWLMFDYNRGYANDIESSGVSDIFRLPKFAFYFFQSQRPPAPKLRPPVASGPMVFIANYWQPGSTTSVRVFSNTEEVALSLNGKLVDRRRPDGDRVSTDLAFPPFTFELDQFEPGTLRAVGFIGDREAASHEVSTAGPAARLALRLDDAGVGLSPDADDLILVHADVLDQEGRPLRNNGPNVRFSVSGSGSLVGPDQTQAEAGIATILVRTIPSNEPLTITAEADELESDTLQIAR